MSSQDVGEIAEIAEMLSKLPPAMRHRVKRIGEEMRAQQASPRARARTVREDGRCQRCKLPALSFCTWSHTSGAEQWHGAYLGGAPPDPGAFTCITCLEPDELVLAQRVNGVQLVNELSQLLAIERTRTAR